MCWRDQEHDKNAKERTEKFRHDILPRPMRSRPLAEIITEFDNLRHGTRVRRVDQK